MINSAQSGPFTSTSTWVGGAVPAPSQDFTVKAGHHVTGLTATYVLGSPTNPAPANWTGQANVEYGATLDEIGITFAWLQVQGTLNHSADSYHQSLAGIAPSGFFALMTSNPSNSPVLNLTSGSGDLGVFNVQAGAAVILGALAAIRNPFWLAFDTSVDVQFQDGLGTAIQENFSETPQSPITAQRGQDSIGLPVLRPGGVCADYSLATLDSDGVIADPQWIPIVMPLRNGQIEPGTTVTLQWTSNNPGLFQWNFTAGSAWQPGDDVTVALAYQIHNQTTNDEESWSQIYRTYIDYQIAASQAITGTPSGGDTLTSLLGKVKLAADGLDAIPTTAPAGVAANFREMIVQLWRRLFKKTVLDRTAATIKTFADDGVTAVTTQPIATTSNQDTQGAAS